MKFTPAAAIFTTASLGLGCGTGKSTSCKTSGPPVCFTWIAFMLDFDSCHAVRDSHGQRKNSCSGQFEERMRQKIWVSPGCSRTGFLASLGMTIFRISDNIRISENIQDIRDFVGNLERVKDPFPTHLLQRPGVAEVI